MIRQLFVLLSLVAACVRAQQPVTFPLTPSSVAGPLMSSPDGGFVFMDAGLARSTGARITQIQVLASGLPTTGLPAPVSFEVWTRAGTFVNNEQSAGWTRVVSSATVTANAGATESVATLAMPGCGFVLAGSNAVNGIAFKMPTGATFAYANENRTAYFDYVEGNAFGSGTPSYSLDPDVAIGSGPFSNATFWVSTASSSSGIGTAAAGAQVFYAHLPHVSFVFDEPLALSFGTVISNSTVVAGAVAPPVTVTSTLTNTGFQHATPVIIPETIVPPSAVTNVQHTSTAVTGCSWRVQRYGGQGGTPQITTLLQAEANITATPNAPATNVPYIKFGNFTDSGEAADAATLNGIIAGAQFGTVLQMRTSFYTSSALFQIGLLTSFFLPGFNIQVYLDGSTIPLTFSSQSGDSPFVTPIDATFYTSDPPMAPAPLMTVGTHDLRVVLFFFPFGPDDFSLEIYGGTSTAFNGGWALLRGSNDPAPVTFANGRWTVPSLCVGGQVTLTTSFTVPSNVENGTVITVTEAVDQTQPSGSCAVVTSTPQIVTTTVINRYTLALSKSTACDRSILSGWSVEFWQSTGVFVNEGTTPFFDFDNTVRLLTPTHVTDGIEAINFGFNNTGYAVGGEVSYNTLAGVAPPAVVNVTDFFLRATSRFVISTRGIYTFATISDRGVRVTIDGKLAILQERLLQNVGGLPFENFYTRFLEAGVHTIEVVSYDSVIPSLLELFIATGGENVFPGDNDNFLPTFDADLSYQLLLTAPVCLLQCSDETLFSGFDVKLWLSTSNIINVGLNLTQSPFTHFDDFIAATTPDGQLCDVQFINFRDNGQTSIAPGNQFGGDLAYPFPAGANRNNFFLQATGLFYIAQAGIYTIGTNSNRGVRLSVDGSILILLEPQSVGTYDRFVSIFLTVGVHTLSVEHYDSLGVSYLEVMIAPGGAPLGTDPLAIGSNLEFALLGSALECQIGTTAETVTAGQPFVFTVVLTNNGPSDVTSINITDVLTINNGATLLGVRRQFGADVIVSTSATSFAWQIVNMPALSSRRIYLDMTVPAAAPVSTDSTAICNSLSAATLPSELLNTPLTLQTCENVTRLVDLVITASATAPIVIAGGAMQQLTITVTNAGPSNTAGFSLTPTITSATGVVIGAPAAFVNVPLAVGESVSRTYNVTAASNALVPATITLSAANPTLNSALERLVHTCGDSASVSIAVQRQSDVRLDKTVAGGVGGTGAVAIAGDAPSNNALVYTMTVLNEGPSDLSDLVVVDSIGNVVDGVLGSNLIDISLGQATASHGVFVSHICPESTAQWSLAAYLVTPAVINADESPFEDLDRLLRAGAPADTTTTTPRLNFIDGGAATFVSPIAPVAFPLPSPHDNVFYVARGAIDVRTDGNFTFGIATNVGLRLWIDDEVKIVLQPTNDVAHTSFFAIELRAGSHAVRVDYYDLAGDSLLQVLVAHGSYLSDSFPFATPYYEFLEPAVCLFGCVARPPQTRWRIAQWRSTNAATRVGDSALENLDRVLASGGLPDGTLTAARIDFGTASAAAPNLPLTGNFYLNAIGQIWISIAGNYTFEVVHPVDGASRLIVDDKTIVADGSTTQTLGTNSTRYTLTLPRGAHDVTLGVVTTSGCTIPDAPATSASCAVMLNMQQYGVSLPATLPSLETANYCQVPTWTIGSLPFNQTATLTLPVTVGCSALIGTLRNRLHLARSLAEPFETLIDEYDGDDSDGVATSIERHSEIVVDVARVGANTPLVAGANSTFAFGSGFGDYTVTVTNRGPSTSDGAKVSVVIHLPEGVTVDAYSPSAGVTVLPTDRSTAAFDWLTGVLLCQTSKTFNVTLEADSIAPCIAGAVNDVQLNATYVSRVNAGEIHTLNPAFDTLTTDIARYVALIVRPINVTATIVDAADTEQVANPRCSTFSVLLENNGPSDIDDAFIVYSLDFPLGVTVEAVSGQSLGPVGPGAVLRTITGYVDETNPSEPQNINLAPLVTLRVCTSPETPAGENNIGITATAVSRGCEIVTNVGQSATRRISTERRVRLVLTKSADVSLAIAAEYAGNAPFTVTVENTGESDATLVDLLTTMTTTLGTTADLHRVLPGRTDVGWLVQTYVDASITLTAGSLGSFQALATTPFSAERYTQLGGAIGALASVGVSNNFLVRASTEFFVVDTEPYVFDVLLPAGGGAFELLVDNVAVAVGTPRTLLAGGHYVELRFVQPAAAVPGSNAAPQVTIDGRVLRGEHATGVQFVDDSHAKAHWLLGVVRAGVGRVTLNERFSALGKGTIPSSIDNEVALSNVAEQQQSAASPASASIPVDVNCANSGPGAVLSLQVLCEKDALCPSTTYHRVRVFNNGPSQCNAVRVHFLTNTTLVSGATFLQGLRECLINVPSGGYRDCPYELQPSQDIGITLSQDAAIGGQITTFAFFPDVVTAPVVQQQRRRAVAQLIETASCTTVTYKRATMRLEVLQVTTTGAAPHHNDVAKKGEWVEFIATVYNDGPSKTTGNAVVYSDDCDNADCSNPSPSPSGTFDLDAPLAGGSPTSKQITFHVDISATTSITQILSKLSLTTASTFAVLPPAVHLRTRIAPFAVGFHLAAFEEGTSSTGSSYSSSSSSSSSDSSDSSSSSDRTRLVFIEVTNTNDELRAKDVAINVAVTDVVVAEALLTQSSRDDVVVNGGSGSFQWTIGKLEHGQRSRIALKLRTTAAHVTVSAFVDGAFACYPDSADCDCPADRKAEIALNKRI